MPLRKASACLCVGARGGLTGESLRCDMTNHNGASLLVWWRWDLASERLLKLRPERTFVSSIPRTKEPKKKKGKRPTPHRSNQEKRALITLNQHYPAHPIPPTPQTTRNNHVNLNTAQQLLDRPLDREIPEVRVVLPHAHEQHRHVGRVHEAD